MNKYLDILIIKLNDRFVGIDCSEISKVIAKVTNESDRKMMTEFRNNKCFFKLEELMDSESAKDSESFILTKMEKGDDIIVEVPEISNFLKIDIMDILVIPEFIRKRQNPFFVWGFVESENKLINLVTFSFFNRG